MENRIKNCWLIISCYVLLIGVNCKAGTESLTAVIDIVVHDQALLKDAVLEFELYKNGISSRYVKDKHYTRTELKDSIRRFTIPLSTAINYGRIIFTVGELREGKSPVNLNYKNNLFLFEHGDTIQVHLYPKKKRDIAFSGNRASKYAAMYKINNDKEMDIQTHRAVNNLLMDNDIKTAFVRMQIWADSLNRELDHALVEIGGSLDSGVRERIFFDNSAYVHKVMRTMMEGIIKQKEDDLELLQIVHATLSEYVFERQSLLNGSIAALSHDWCDMLLFNERFRSKIACILSQEAPCDITNLGESLSKRYSGPVSDKLCYLALLRNLDEDGIIRNALQGLKTGDNENSRYRRASIAFLARSEGAAAFDFEMVDVNGVTHRLSDYKGKVVVIDFWFSGCMACMYLTKQMQEAVKFFENSDDVVFVSLNFDRYPDFWKRSLASEKYTHESGINLWSGNTGINHPIIGYYGIQSFPTLFVVNKDGILVERHVNRLFTKNNPTATAKFKELVNKYR